MNYKEYKSPSFIEAYKNAFIYCFDIDNRSRRAEYFKFIGICYLLLIVTFIIGMVLYATFNSDTLGKILFGIFFIVHIVPSYTLLARRLHDSGHTAKWILAALIPGIGSILGIFILVWIFMDSDKEDNEWGESPKYYVENK